MRNLATALPTADSPQGNIVVQTIHQLLCVAHVVNRIGHNGACHRTAVRRGTTHPPLPASEHTINRNKVQHRHQLPELASQRTKLLLQHWEQTSLHHTKKLLQLFAEGNLHSEVYRPHGNWLSQANPKRAPPKTNSNRPGLRNFAKDSLEVFCRVPWSADGAGSRAFTGRDSAHHLCGGVERGRKLE